MARDLDRYLGDGGMALLGHLGVCFSAYTPERAEAEWVPTRECCNPQGMVQAGVHAVVLDAAMNFAMLAGLESGERGATLEMTVSTMRPAREGDTLHVVGTVTRLAKRVAWCDAQVLDDDQQVMSRASGVFIVNRRADSTG
ncbi:MAG: PaaI family thioesterase [Acidimicrobiia bacterium]